MNWARLSPLASIVTLALILPSLSTLANAKRHWQVGKLVNIEEAASEKIGYVSGNQDSMVGGYSECRNWVYTVETESMTYVFSAHTGAWCADHPRPLTIGNQVRFALEPKAKVLLIDEDGKEFKGIVVNKVMANHTR